MDKTVITPSSLNGHINIPPSKSYAHRAIIAAFLSGEECKINNIDMSEDILATLSCIKALGGDFKHNQTNSELDIIKNKSCISFPELLCNESGSTLRFFIPIALCFCENVKFSGKGRLMERPLTPYFEIFDKLGINYHKSGSDLTIKGKLKAGEFEIDGSISSQFITGLLFALPLLSENSRIIIQGELSSKAYTDITLDVLKKFGIEIKNCDYKSFEIKGNQKYRSQNYTVEGDFSQAAFFLTAGALGCDIVCKGLNFDSLQGDKKILQLIEAVGAKIERVDSTSFRVCQNEALHAITVDADEIPDLVPVLAVLLSFCKGESKIINAGRLRLKESDRLSAISSQLKNIGADIFEEDDFLVINGKEDLCGGETSSCNDHRIAMALAIAACRCKEEVTISGANKAIKKSYPDFFKDYQKLGGKVQ